MGTCAAARRAAHWATPAVLSSIPETQLSAGSNRDALALAMRLLCVAVLGSAVGGCAPTRDVADASDAVADCDPWANIPDATQFACDAIAVDVEGCRGDPGLPFGGDGGLNYPSGCEATVAEVSGSDVRCQEAQCGCSALTCYCNLYNQPAVDGGLVWMCPN
jgi:hypothetical protein